MPSFDSRYFFDKDILTPYVRDNYPHRRHNPVRVGMRRFLFAYVCPRHGDKGIIAQSINGKRTFLQACDFHWVALSGRTSLPAAAGLDLPFARSDDEYRFFRCLALALEDSSPLTSVDFFCRWSGICHVSQSIMDEIYTPPPIRVDFRNI